MLAALVVLLRTFGLLCRGHGAVALENVALRQQLSVLRRTVSRPQLRTRDRLFWVLLAKAWPDWRTALIVVQPDTVVRWHRQWLRRRWTQRSRQITIRPPEHRRRDSGAHRQDGIRDSAVGRTANPWRVAQAGHRCLGANGLADRREVSATAIPEVAHLPHKSPRRDRLHGLLHRAHAHGPRVVRAGPPRAPTSSS